MATLVPLEIRAGRVAQQTLLHLGRLHNLQTSGFESDHANSDSEGGDLG